MLEAYGESLLHLRSCMPVLRRRAAAWARPFQCRHGSPTSPCPTGDLKARLGFYRSDYIHIHMIHMTYADILYCIQGVSKTLNRSDATVELHLEASEGEQKATPLAQELLKTLWKPLPQGVDQPSCT